MLKYRLLLVFIHNNIHNTTRIVWSLILSFVLMCAVIVEGYALSKFEKDSEETTQTEKEGERAKEGEIGSLNPFEKISGGDGNNTPLSIDASPNLKYCVNTVFAYFHAYYPHLYNSSFDYIDTVGDTPQLALHLLYQHLLFYDTIA